MNISVNILVNQVITPFICALDVCSNQEVGLELACLDNRESCCYIVS